MSVSTRRGFTSRVPDLSDIERTDTISVSLLSERYDRGRLIGEGGSAKVYEARDRVTGNRVALKEIKLEGLAAKKLTRLGHEKEVLRLVKHPNIIHLIETVKDPEAQYLVFELMQCNLTDHVSRLGKLREDQALSILHQILNGLHCLHSAGVAHRDIKPDNILLSFHPVTKEVIVKVADLGLSRLFQSPIVQVSPCGTSGFMAPEIIRGLIAEGLKPFATERTSVVRMDMWSCGIVLYAMITGRLPFSSGAVHTHAARRDMLASMDRGALFPSWEWSKVRAETRELCERLLDRDPLRRPLADEAMLHPAFDLIRGVIPDRADKLTAENLSMLQSEYSDCSSSMDMSPTQRAVAEEQRRLWTNIAQDARVADDLEDALSSSGRT